MARPPMNQSLTLHVTQLDPNGEPMKDRNGRPLRLATQLDGVRVKLSADRIFSKSGDETQAVMEIAFPPEVNVQDGDVVEWADQFGKVHRGPIEKIKEVLNYGGDVVYYRKAWTT